MAAVEAKRQGYRTGDAVGKGVGAVFGPALFGDQIGHVDAGAGVQRLQAGTLAPAVLDLIQQHCHGVAVGGGDHLVVAAHRDTARTPGHQRDR